MTSALGPLFDAPVQYQRWSDTSKAAAESMDAEVAVLRARVMAAYEDAGKIGLSADQCAAKLDVSILAIRPRVTEAFMKGDLVKTDRTVRNESGRPARVLVKREALLSR